MTIDTLYETDFVTWTERQAEALRDAGRQASNLPIDWENLAEEIKDLGSEVRNRVASLARLIHIHLLKIACSAANEPRRHWMGELDEFRNQLARQLRNNHALRAGFSAISDDEFLPAVDQVERTFRRHDEPQSAIGLLTAWKVRGISATELQADGLYPEPGTRTFGQPPA